jgi:hypothetical protein
MKYLITESKLMETMDKFFEKNFPEIELPLIRKKSVGRGNRGYGSSFDDYTYINYYYYSDHAPSEDPLFIKWDDNHTFSNEKWSVHEQFELIYDFFGEENFEEFVKWKFGLNITKRGNKLHNWTFE